jgi:hypothetical protein
MRSTTNPRAANALLSSSMDRSMPPALKLANTSATRRAALVAGEDDVEVIS